MGDRFGFGSPTPARAKTARSGDPGSRGLAQDDRGLEGHLAARLNGVPIIFVLSRQHRQECLCHKAKDYEELVRSEGGLIAGIAVIAHHPTPESQNRAFR